MATKRTDEAQLIKRLHRLARSDRLRELREAGGLSQADVARYMEVAPSQVSRWEAGLSRPRPWRIGALLDLLEGGMNLAERVLTVPEAAALLGVSPATYYAAASRGEVPALRVGRRLVVSGFQLSRLLGSEEFSPGEGVITTNDASNTAPPGPTEGRVHT